MGELLQTHHVQRYINEMKEKDTNRGTPHTILTNFLKKKEKKTKKVEKLHNGKKLVEGTEAIKVAKEYYQDLYSDEPISKKKINNFLKNTGVKLNQKEKKLLDKPFTIKEIKDAMNLFQNGLRLVI